MRPVSIRIGRPGQPFPEPRRFRQGVVLIGRSRECDVQLEEPGVSRRHCRLLVDGDRLLVEDLGSRHGTSVDGEALEAGVARPLVDGGVLHVEGFVLEVTLLPAEAPAGASARPPGLAARAAARPAPQLRRAERRPEPSRPIPVLHPVDEAPTPPPADHATLTTLPRSPARSAQVARSPAPAAPLDLLEQLGPEFLRRVERDSHAIAAALDALSRTSSN